MKLLRTYALLVGPPLVGLLVVLALGRSLTPGGAAALAPAAAPAGGPGAPDLLLLLAQIAVVLLAARLFGRLLRALGQPQVVGEMVAGIVLGPSVLGTVAPGVSAMLFPPASLGFLSALAQVGLLVFMFLVGLELDLRQLRERGHTALVTSHASIVAPFLLGAALALLLFPRLAPAGVPFTGFALFLGAAMSVTAFPVLARILAERGLLRTRLGAVAIACAAVDDVTAWCILAGVVALVRAEGHGLPVWGTVVGSAAYVVLMLTVGRRLLARLGDAFRKHRAASRDLVAVVVVALLASAWTTEWLGIHALFGAFLVGAVMPRDEGLVRALTGKFEDVMVVLLLPLFFAFTGLRTRIALIEGSEAWLLCGLVVLVAVVGKLGGSAVAARATGMPWREATALGVLMNTRGLMELVILNVGLDVGIISPTLFAMMVLMALATTAMTSPLMAWLVPARSAAATPLPRADDPAPAGAG